MQILPLKKPQRQAELLRAHSESPFRRRSIPMLGRAFSELLHPGSHLLPMPQLLEPVPPSLTDLRKQQLVVPAPPIPPPVQTQGLNLPEIHRSTGAAIDLQLQDGIFPQLGDLEVCVPLSNTFLAVAMVLPLGTARLFPIRWLVAVCCTKAATNLWQTWMSGPQLSKANSLRISAEKRQLAMIHGQFRRLQTRLVEMLIALTRALSLLLDMIASSTWVWMLVIAHMAPQGKAQWKIKITLAPLAKMFQWMFSLLTRQITMRLPTWRFQIKERMAWITQLLGQRRMALTRLLRHESNCLELSRYGQGPWQ
ncbi:uncharacterized protein LOC125535077 [Triticum urartu]|uniref:uncharacterized protein LOC125535077 n=1 Tax=Triticum urartu TaxID=4572 RepID=UPI00204454D5|nr:uncharacterized protein LOC125535077 [Triticum urartu]